MATSRDETNAAADALTSPTNTGRVTRLPNQAGMGDSNKTIVDLLAGGAATPAGVSGQ